MPGTITITLVLACALVLPLGSAASSSLLEKMQADLDALAKEYNTSFSVGYASADGVVSIASGVADALTGERMTTDAMVPAGSVTKTFTAAAAMKLVEQGYLDLDAPAYKYADPVLQSINGSTLLEIWKGDATINTVTVRHLLSMRSCLHDYDDAALSLFTVTHPGEDVSPVDYLYEVDKTWLCKPGEGGAYTSVGFTLLGFVLTGADPYVNTWNDYDQRGFMTPAQKIAWNRTSFPKTGRCTEYDVAPQWGVTVVDSGTTALFYDFAQFSCLNGWTCGNVAISGHDLASFFYSLMVGQIVNATSLAEMTTFKGLTTGWSTGLPYGLGLMSTLAGWPVNVPDYAMIGHGGQDYASSCQTCGFNTKYRFGLAVIVNSQVGMNCTSLSEQQPPDDQSKAGQIAGCHMQNLIVAELSGGKAPPLKCGDEPQKGDGKETEAVRPSPLSLLPSRQHARTRSARSARTGRRLTRIGVPRHEHAALEASASNNCAGNLVALNVFVPDGACHALSATESYRASYTYPAATGNITTFMGSADCTSSSGTPQPSTVMINPPACAENVSPVDGQRYAYLFYYNTTSHVIVQLVWKVNTIRQCAWTRELPASTPTPTPLDSKQLIEQLFASPDCDPTTATPTQGKAWVPVPTDMCLPDGTGTFYKISCPTGGTTVTGIQKASSDCSGGTTSSVALGACLKIAPTKSVRFELLGPSVTC